MKPRLAAIVLFVLGFSPALPSHANSTCTYVNLITIDDDNAVGTGDCAFVAFSSSPRFVIKDEVSAAVAWTACQDVNGDHVCGENEPNSHGCSSDVSINGVVPGLPVEVLFRISATCAPASVGTVTRA